MQEEMFAFFPNGIRALVVDDDPKFVRSATMMLSLLNFKVATCGSPTSALRLLTGDRLKDVNVVLADAHKVATCGFDFRAIIEPDLHIPVIHVFSPRTPIDSDDMCNLLHTIHTATYVIKKPLEASEVVTLWKVVMWRKRFLDARVAYGGGTPSFAAGGQGDSSLLPLWDGVDAGDDDDKEDQRVHFKVVKSGGGSRRKRKSRRGGGGGAGSSDQTLKHWVMWTPCLRQKFERAVKDVGIDGHPSKILEHMNVEGLGRNHVASYLQKYRKKALKDGKGKNQESLFVQSVLQTLSIPPHNRAQIFADVAGPSNATAAAFAGNGDPFALDPLPPAFQQPAGNAFDYISPASTMPAEGQQYFGGNDAAAPVPLPPAFQQPFWNPFDCIAPAAVMPAKRQQFFGDNDTTALAPLPPVFLQDGGNAFEGIAPAAAMPAERQQSFGGNVAPPTVPWPLVLQQPAGNVTVSTAPAAAAMPAEWQQCSGGLVAFPFNFFGPFSYQGPLQPAAPLPLRPTPTDVDVDLDENEALMDELLSSNGGPVVASDEGELVAMIASDHEDLMFPLDALLGPDVPVDFDGGIAQQGAIDDAAAAANGFLNDEAEGMGNWFVETDGFAPLDEILKDSTGVFVMPNGMAGLE